MRRLSARVERRPRNRVSSVRFSLLANAALASNEGFKFGRQVPIGRYIADFARHEARLIVEIGSAPPVAN